MSRLCWGVKEVISNEALQSLEIVSLLLRSLSSGNPKIPSLIGLARLQALVMPLNYPSETERSKPARKLGSYRVVYFVANIANPLAVNVGILNNDVSFPSGCWPRLWSTIYSWFSYILSVFSHLAIDAVQRRRYHVIECPTGRRIDAVR